IGSSNAAHERGLIMHNALAFTASGVPLGILSQRIWARQEVPEEGYQEKIERLQVTQIEEKESSKWMLALEEKVARDPRGAEAGEPGRLERGKLKPPHRRGAAKVPGATEPLAVHAIWAAEKSAPQGAEPISWVLLTNLPVADFEAASEKIGWYGKRFAIETWH